MLSSEDAGGFAGIPVPFLEQFDFCLRRVAGLVITVTCFWPDSGNFFGAGVAFVPGRRKFLLVKDSKRVAGVKAGWFVERGAGGAKP